MNVHGEDKVFESAVDVWKEISLSAHFEDVGYDRALFDEIKSSLLIDERADFSKELENISVEELLNALFKSIEPFSEMLKDLLEVFSKAGAKYSDKNLKIAVDFGKLNVDLENFKVDVETITQLVKKSVKTYFIANPWSLRELFCFRKNGYCAWDSAEIDDRAIREWVDAYCKDILPPSFPSAPRFREEVDCRVKLVWDYLYKIYKLVKSVYREEAGIRHSVRDQIKNLSALSDTESANAGVFLNETDLYLGTMMVAITKFVEHLQTLDGQECEELIEKFKGRFDDVFQGYQSAILEETVENIKQLNSFLNLPYWEHRYEIYSAWVFTLIVKAFGDSNLNYALVNGNTLSFSFGGSHLATYDQELPLEIWAECRSEAIEKTMGKGRIGGIQPDYTIAYNDVKISGNAVAVVECKQYKKSNAGNFSAIIDYAKNRPNAKIFLVDYGKVGGSVNKKVIGAGIDASRFATFGNVRPGNADSFVKELKSYLFETLVFTLKWGSIPADLDLMLEIISPKEGSRCLINYMNMGSGDASPYAVLNTDCRKGYGPEIITVFRVDRGKKYFAKIKKYSSEKNISGEITLTVEYKDFKKEYTKNELFDIWNVCTVQNGQLETIDTIEKYN